jgi:hypothetical protein
MNKWTACTRKQCDGYDEGYEFNCKISGFTYYVSSCQKRDDPNLADLMEDK